MKDRILYALLISCLILAIGCDSKRRRSGSKQNDDSAPEATALSREDFKKWRLSDGEQFDCWVSGDNRSSKPCWIWCDVEKGPVSYRIVSGENRGDWKPMRKITVTDDGKIIPDANGQFGANEVLPAGKYAVEFKIGEQVFSAVTLRVK